MRLSPSPCQPQSRPGRGRARVAPVAVVVAALALSACSSESERAVDLRSRIEAPDAAPEAALEPLADPRRAPVRAMVALTEAGSAALQVEWGSPGEERNRMSGAADFAVVPTAMHLSGTGPEALDTVVVDGRVHLRDPASNEGRWLNVAVVGADDPQAGYTASQRDAVVLLRAMARSRSVQELGEDSSSGVPVQGWSFTVGAAEHLAAAQMPEELAERLSGPVRYELWVDALGLPRRIVHTVSAAPVPLAETGAEQGETVATRHELVLSDHGLDVDVLAPADSTALDEAR